MTKQTPGSVWQALAYGLEGTGANMVPQFDATLLMALAASGRRIAAATSLADWRAVLVDEVWAYLPGAECNVYLSADWPPVRATSEADEPVVVSLDGADQLPGRLVVLLPPGIPRAGAAALLAMLGQMAAQRLAQLPDRVDSAIKASEREQGLLVRLQDLAQLFTTRLDPQSLFDEVVRLAAELTDGETATLLLDEPQGRGLVVQAEWGHPDGARPRCYLGRWGVAGMVIRHDQIVLIDHAPSDPRYAAPAFGQPGKSLVGVPLRRGGKVIGSLNVSNHSKYFAFTQSHIDLLLLLAHYATIGIEVANLLAEREDRNVQLQSQNQILTGLYEHVSRQAREQSALYAISRRIQSTPDIEEALPSVLGVLCDLIRAESAEIYLAHNLAPVAPTRIASLVAQWGLPLRAAQDSTQITLPLRRGDYDLGRIVLARSTTQGAFETNDLALAGAVADQLTLALENRSLLVRDLATLYEVPQGKRAPLDLTQLVLRLLVQTQSIAALDGAAALLYDAATDDWEVAAEVGTLPGYWPLPPAQQRALLDQLRRTQEPVRHVPAPGESGALLLLVPMLDEDRLVGAFALPGLPGHHLSAKLPFLSALAGRAAVMIHNIQLQLRAEELLITEERNRIAREMHDGLAQTLTQIRIRCEYVSRILPTDPDRAQAELNLLRAELKNSTAELVRVINALAPPTLGDLGLIAALQKLGDEFSSPGRLRVEVAVPAADPELPPQIELTLFRVAQEWLRNVAWHVGVSRCRVVLTASSAAVRLTIEDNGNANGNGHAGGVAAAEPNRGLHLIRERVTEFGGALDIALSESGTELTVTLPLVTAHSG